MRELTYEQWVEKFKPIMDGDKPKEFTYEEAKLLYSTYAYYHIWIGVNWNNELTIIKHGMPHEGIIYCCHNIFGGKATVHTGIVTNDQLLVCAQCGSYNIEKKAWVNANTNQYIEDTSNRVTICNDCDEEVDIITIKEFNLKPKH